MERFTETLKPLEKAQTVEIGKEMVQSILNEKSKMNLERFDWERTIYADPRDPRTTQGVCRGHHTLAKFYRGSSSGTNAFGLWLCCQKCMLRVMYTPTWGSKATSRAAGPLPADVKEKLNKHPENDVHPQELETRALALEAAEASTRRHLEKLQKEKASLATKKAEGKTAPCPSKKTVKRDHPLSPEVQEQTEQNQSPSTPSHEGWVQLTENP